MGLRVHSLAAAVAAMAVATGSAQARQVNELDDPANLAGERVGAPAAADTLPINHGAAALGQLLLKLRTRASLMLIVAHPDDEDSGLLTLESRGRGARVAMLTLTRGEGGQNLMSADFNDALGLIRTQELLAEDRVTGVDQFFGTEVDFGFSKTREETLAQWTHQRVLYDAVRAVRLYRPLVLASVFLGAPTDGHGHHQMAGQITQEVFAAAADPKVFPEMGLAPWAPLKVYARVPFARVTPAGMYDYATGRTLPLRFHNYLTGADSNEVPRANVIVHEGEPAMLFGRPTPGMGGMSYAQFARTGLALQKTQIGAGVPVAPAGRADVGYTRMGTRLPASPTEEDDLFTGIDTGLPALAPAGATALRAALVALDGDLARAQAAFSVEHPEATAPPLHDALGKLDALLTRPDAQDAAIGHELRIKRVQINDALVLARGVALRAMLSSSRPGPIPQPRLGEALEIAVDLASAGLRVRDLAVELRASRGEAAPSTRVAQSFSRTVRTAVSLREHGEAVHHLTLPFSLPAETPVTVPFFSRPSLKQPFYDVLDPALRSAPQTPPPLVVAAHLLDGGVELEVRAEVTLPQPDAPAPAMPSPAAPPARKAPSGEIATSAAPPIPAPEEAALPAVLVRSPVSVELAPAAGIVRPGERSLAVRGSARADAGLDPVLRLLTPPGWKSTREPGGAAAEAETGFEVAVPPALAPGSQAVLTAEAAAAGHTYTTGYRMVGYPGLVLTDLPTPATYRATAVDARVAPGLRVGYLPGTGDAVPDYLPNLGVHPTLLRVSDLEPPRLAAFDVILLGVRAYAAHPELRGAGSGALVDFARAGGTVIVQYNTGGYGTESAPAALEVPGDPAHNVVVEAAPGTLLEPAAPVLQWPNRLGPADFTGWVAEWGHGFAARWDPSYSAPLEVHDPDQDPQRGGLLIARVGRGHYVYCALALYRQLPEGVPGAWRLLANLLSLGRAPAGEPASK